MKIAFLHFAFCGLSQKVNQEKILLGMDIAAKAGASWVLTPEMSLHGYTMIREEYPLQMASLNNGVLTPFMQAAKKYSQRLFLGCAFTDMEAAHNSCLVIDQGGNYCGRHDKVKVVQWITEKWAHPGEKFEVYEFDGIKTSVMVCADIYFAEHGTAVAEQGAQLIVGSVAWPEGDHGGPPRAAWQRMSGAAGNIPVLIANQTGSLRMDCSQAESAVVDKGKVLFTYAGAEAVLIMEYDKGKHCVLSDAFQVIPLNQET